MSGAEAQEQSSVDAQLLREIEADGIGLGPIGTNTALDFYATHLKAGGAKKLATSKHIGASGPKREDDSGKQTLHSEGGLAKKNNKDDIDQDGGGSTTGRGRKSWSPLPSIMEEGELLAGGTADAFSDDFGSLPFDDDPFAIDVTGPLLDEFGDEFDSFPPHHNAAALGGKVPWRCLPDVDAAEMLNLRGRDPNAGEVPFVGEDVLIFLSEPESTADRFMQGWYQARVLGLNEGMMKVAWANVELDRSTDLQLDGMKWHSVPRPPVPTQQDARRFSQRKAAEAATRLPCGVLVGASAATSSHSDFDDDFHPEEKSRNTTSNNVKKNKSSSHTPTEEQARSRLEEMHLHGDAEELLYRLQRALVTVDIPLSRRHDRFNTDARDVSIMPAAQGEDADEKVDQEDDLLADSDDGESKPKRGKKAGGAKKRVDCPSSSTSEDVKVIGKKAPPGIEIADSPSDAEMDTKGKGSTRKTKKGKQSRRGSSASPPKKQNKDTSSKSNSPAKMKMKSPSPSKKKQKEEQDEEARKVIDKLNNKARSSSTSTENTSTEKPAGLETLRREAQRRAEAEMVDKQYEKQPVLVDDAELDRLRNPSSTRWFGDNTDFEPKSGPRWRDWAFRKRIVSARFSADDLATYLHAHRFWRNMTQRMYDESLTHGPMIDAWMKTQTKVRYFFKMHQRNKKLWSEFRASIVPDHTRVKVVRLTHAEFVIEDRRDSPPDESLLFRVDAQKATPKVSATAAAFSSMTRPKLVLESVAGKRQQDGSADTKLSKGLLENGVVRTGSAVSAVPASYNHVNMLTTTTGSRGSDEEDPTDGTRAPSPGRIGSYQEESPEIVKSKDEALLDGIRGKKKTSKIKPDQKATENAVPGETLVRAHGWKLSDEFVEKYRVPEGVVETVSRIFDEHDPAQVFFYPSGVYSAPSRIGKNAGYGLFSFYLRTPMECVGDFGGKCTSIPTFDKTPHADFTEKYAMSFQNGVVSCMIDPCWGKDIFDRRLHPFAVMNEPPPGVYANCEVVSKIEESLTVSLEPWRQNLLRVYANLPILPCDELFIHYGRDFARENNYEVGLPSPLFFKDLGWTDHGTGDLTKQGVLRDKPFSVVEWKRKVGLCVRREEAPRSRVRQVKVTKGFRQFFNGSKCPITGDQRPSWEKLAVQPRFYKRRRNPALYSCNGETRAKKPDVASSTTTTSAVTPALVETNNKYKALRMTSKGNNNKLKGGNGAPPDVVEQPPASIVASPVTATSSRSSKDTTVPEITEELRRRFPERYDPSGETFAYNVLLAQMRRDAGDTQEEILESLGLLRKYHQR
ncbi:unnamed protein product [Amoebophrya sp. A25]|nr:unnamed protein product [Amoebophrya sp. A25]|eukprot:GSA25T00013979001.1